VNQPVRVWHARCVNVAMRFAAFLPGGSRGGRIRAAHRSPIFRLAAFALAALLLAAARPGNVGAAESEQSGSAAIVLVYHRFGPAVTDTMTVTTASFFSQLDYLRTHGYQIVPLRRVIDFAAGTGTIPSRAVAITADDGHRTVFTEMKPIVERYRIPVTLFIYPSAISNASYAMTWDQLSALKATGWFDIELHTYWHPNFKIERKRLTPGEFDQFARSQLLKSRAALETHLGLRPDLLAWPFGIYEDDLIGIARACGYAAAFTIERRPVRRGDNVMALPRYLITAATKGRDFEAVLRAGANRQSLSR
jgi:peptidoglycan/xylan/chitin deacetylase (PgdA/CDA1 family)